VRVSGFGFCLSGTWDREDVEVEDMHVAQEGEDLVGKLDLEGCGEGRDDLVQGLGVWV
jgi:hypothetical protein